MSSPSTATPPPAKQPIHPSMLPKLDPEYIAYHNKYIQYISPPNTLPWNPDIRKTPTFTVGPSVPKTVGKVEDHELSKTKVRAFTPEGKVPEGGWPVMIYFHGGGWTLGGIESEGNIITNLCVRAKCVVVSVDYRLAPEHKFPTAVEDAVEALQWVLKNGKQVLDADLNRIATGGVSSGGNLAAVLALKSSESTFSPPLPSPMSLQLLIVPVIDNTATAEPGGRWEPNQHAPFLSPGRMNWFKGLYFRSESDWTVWEASPIFAPDELLKRAPKAWIAVGEVDILRNEGEAYGEKLKELGVDVEVAMYEKGTHVFMVVDGEMIKMGETLITNACDVLARAFGTAV